MRPESKGAVATIFADVYSLQNIHVFTQTQRQAFTAYTYAFMHPIYASNHTSIHPCRIKADRSMGWQTPICTPDWRKLNFQFHLISPFKSGKTNRSETLRKPSKTSFFLRPVH